MLREGNEQSVPAGDAPGVVDLAAVLIHEGAVASRPRHERQGVRRFGFDRQARGPEVPRPPVT